MECLQYDNVDLCQMSNVAGLNSILIKKIYYKVFGLGHIVPNTAIPEYAKIKSDQK